MDFVLGIVAALIVLSLIGFGLGCFVSSVTAIARDVAREEIKKAARLEGREAK